jgi:penicillin-binding protein 1A
MLYSIVDYDGNLKSIIEKELDGCIKAAEVEEKLLTTFVTISSFVFIVVVSIFSTQGSTIFANFLEKATIFQISVFGILIVAIFLVINLALADKFRSIAYNHRKIVMLRAQVGLFYEQVNWILPRNAVEGASNPFRVSLAPPFLSFRMLPVHIFNASSFLFLYGMFIALNKTNISVNISLFIGYITVYFVFYNKLSEQHGNFYFQTTKIMAKIFNFPIVFNFEYAIYRSWLAGREIDRLGIDTRRITSILVAVEDRRFFKHFGVDLFAIARAIKYRIFSGKRSGASTISQQLARSIFFRKMKFSIRRKILEIIAALALERSLRKTEIAKLYLSSVRFDVGIIGLPSAIKHFFPLKFSSPNLNLSAAEEFFLIERLSNTKMDILSSKISKQLKYMIDADVLTKHDAHEVVEVFYSQIRAGRIIPSDEDALAKIAKAIGPV